jgi:hypothetical protein
MLSMAAAAQDLVLPHPGRRALFADAVSKDEVARIGAGPMVRDARQEARSSP